MSKSSASKTELFARQLNARAKLTSVETFGTFDPASRRLALAACPLQKHFACRQQITTTHQFDAWGRDSKRVGARAYQPQQSRYRAVALPLGRQRSRARLPSRRLVREASSADG